MKSTAGRQHPQHPLSEDDDWGFLSLFDRPIAFHPAFVHLTGSITAALMLSQMIYWTKKSLTNDGWFYKSQEHWTEETCMTRAEQEAARRRLRDCGLLQESRKDLKFPGSDRGYKRGQVWFRLNRSALRKALGKNLGMLKFSNAEIQQCRNSAMPKFSIRNAEIQHSPTPPIRKERLHRDKEPPTPTPHAAQGRRGGVEPSAHDPTDHALSDYATRIGVTSRRVLKHLRDPMRHWMREHDVGAYAAADEMAKRWTAYLNDPNRIGKPMSMTIFFTQGYWLNPESWVVLTTGTRRAVN